MSKTILQSPKESVTQIAMLFRALCNSSSNNFFTHTPLHLFVREDVCFGDKWLNLGEIILKPNSNTGNDEEFTYIEDAVRFGFYEWIMLDFERLQSDCFDLMNIKDTKDDKIKDRTRRALSSIIDAAMRLGFLFPKFDADMITELPFTRPTTVVADTNAIGKGGVDFLIRFLYPMARLKIPAIVAMEILNQSDIFFSKRRSVQKNEDIRSNKKSGLLFDHVISQAGQRAMLRFELHSDIEIERTSIFSNPLRNAFTPLKDNSWQDLNLSAPVRSYCDRLILETVRQHLSSVSPGHPVILMTGDEGLARMALAEGIRPFFFHASRPPELYNQVLAGTRFHPFSSEIFSIPLQCLLWEFAVTFGNARLATQDNSKFFEVSAISQELNWQPFHAKDDLLPIKWEGFDLSQEGKEESPPIEAETQNKRNQRQTQKKIVNSKKINASIKKPVSNLNRSNPSTVYRFSLTILFDFIASLLKKGNVPITGEGTPLEGLSQTSLRKYKGFMLAGKFIEIERYDIRYTDSLQNLWDSLIRRDLEKASQYFQVVPSFKTFLSNLEKHRIEVRPEDPERKRPSPAYVQIAELCGHAIQIPQDGIYGTFSNPSLSDFVEHSILTYEQLRKGEDYVLTGLWLETLVREYGIHPIKVRDRLAEAQAAGMIERSTQGSTPDTRFENHTLTVLRIDNGFPIAEKAHLYHGDFIIPGKASVSIRLERK